MKGVLIFAFLAFAVLVGGFLLVFGSGPSQVEHVVVGDPSMVATIYKSPTCGCCGNYVAYMKKHTGFDIQVVDTDDMDAIKAQNHISEDFASCHTTLVGGYFVEGHIPLEVIGKLIAEKPEIAGIALPGMPSGSPGMPGTKNGPFSIHAIASDGSHAGTFINF